MNTNYFEGEKSAVREHDIDQAYQSNIRAGAFIAENLVRALESKNEAAITKALLTVLVQVNYTDRCLSGVVTPETLQPESDQRPLIYDALALVAKHSN